MPSDINFNNTHSKQHQDTIDLELRSQLDMAKNDLTVLHNNLHQKFKQEVNKYPQFAQEDSEVKTRLNDLTDKFQIFEDEIVKRTKDLLKSYKLLKHENTNILKRLGEGATTKEIEMAIDLVKSELDE